MKPQLFGEPSLVCGLVFFSFPLGGYSGRETKGQTEGPEPRTRRQASGARRTRRSKNQLAGGLKFSLVWRLRQRERVSMQSIATLPLYLDEVSTRRIASSAQVQITLRSQWLLSEGRQSDFHPQPRVKSPRMDTRLRRVAAEAERVHCPTRCI